MMPCHRAYAVVPIWCASAHGMGRVRAAADEPSDGRDEADEDDEGNDDEGEGADEADDGDEDAGRGGDGAVPGSRNASVVDGFAAALAVDALELASVDGLASADGTAASAAVSTAVATTCAAKRSMVLSLMCGGIGFGRTRSDHLMAIRNGTQWETNQNA
jgi:hypothetical protein